MDLSLFFNHSGDSLITTPEIVTAEYRGQASVFSTVTGIVSLVESILKLSTEGNLMLKIQRLVRVILP